MPLSAARLGRRKRRGGACCVRHSIARVANSRGDGAALAAFLQMKAPELLVFDHCDDIDDDPRKFRVTITFDSQSNGKTVVTMRQLHPTKARNRNKHRFAWTCLKIGSAGRAESELIE
jgi:uncharacterized protein YndB with AHSA1/START domain